MSARLLLLLPLIMLSLMTTIGHASDIEKQRTAFVKAEKALKRGATKEFNRLRKNLGDYPLYPYLEYQALVKKIERRGPAEIENFLARHHDTLLAPRLRGRWLDHLAKHKRWTEYLSFYKDTDNVSRRCYRLSALMATGKKDEALLQVAEIWLHGKSRPRACDPVFKAWEKAGHRTTAMNWQRIEKAMEAGEWRLAEYLGRGLSNADKVWLKRWVRLHRTPRHAADIQRFDKAHPYRETMLSHAVRRLARWDGFEAMQLWHRLKPAFDFNPAQITKTEHHIVRNLVRVPEETAYDFIRTVDVGENDLEVHHARIRAALLREDWWQVIRWIAALPESERDKDRWSYWLARALEGNGDQNAADARYRKVAESRTYYGFMAADRVDVPYHLAHNETPVSTDDIAHIAQNDGIRRASEFLALDRTVDARREWRETTRDMDRMQLKAAAKFAEQQGWHDQAIFTLARTGFWDDLELRFPLEHTELVEQNARLHGIDIAWIFAVMRQESAFMRNARSHAGAMGLMQLMPATAKSVARQVLKRKPPKRRELFRPDTNIALGSAYLKQMKGRLGDSAVLATAAYNAGPHRVDRWLPARTLPADIWIELVPFRETRGYLRRVLAYTVIYEKRMGLTPTRLRERLHPVPPSIGMLEDAIASTLIPGAG